MIRTPAEKNLIAKTSIAFFQICTYILISRVFRRFFLANRNVSRTINQLRRGSLIISNHQSILDPFITLSYLPFRSFLKMLPLRFPMTHSYYRWLPFLWLLGAYDIGVTKRERMAGLFRTRKFLFDRESVMIFPEGKISDENEILDFQKGVTFLTEIAANVIFVKMEGFHQKNWFNMKVRRSVIFSEVQSFDDVGNSENFRTFIRKLSTN